MRGPLLAAMLVGAGFAGCLGAPPPVGDGGEPSGGVPLMGLGGCRGTIHRFLASMDAMRPLVHPAFELYEGTDVAEVPGAGTTAVSVSAYRCEGGGDAPNGAHGVVFIFARVHPPEGVDVPPPLTYVARFYAPEPLARFAAARGLPAQPANVTHDFGGLAGNDWSVAIESADGAFDGGMLVDPLGATTTEGSGPFLAVTADETAVTWLLADINVTARQGQGRASATGDFGAFTGGQEASFSGAVVDPLEFPIALHRRPWNGTAVPPPPDPPTE